MAEGSRVQVLAQLCLQLSLLVLEHLHFEERKEFGRGNAAFLCLQAVDVGVHVVVNASDSAAPVSEAACMTWISVTGGSV